MASSSSKAPGPSLTTITTSGDLALKKPEGWLDKSMVILTAPPEGDAFPPSIVVNRMPLPEDQTIAEYANLAARDGAEEFDGFELLDQDPAQVRNHSAPAFRFRWDSPRGRATHRQVYLPGADQTVLSVTFSTLVHSENQAWPLFDTVLASIKL